MQAHKNMTAKEAREMLKQATEQLSGEHEQQLNGVISAIADAIKKEAKEELWWDGPLHHVVVGKLRAMGYSVDRHSHRNDELYKISWAEPLVI